MSKVNILVLIKTSSEDEDEKRLHQDECLLGFTAGPWNSHPRSFVEKIPSIFGTDNTHSVMFNK